MKRKNMKVGMKVVVKPNAIGYAAEYIGTTQSLIVEQGCVWLIDVECLGKGGEAIVVMPREVRKATQHEITAAMLSSMTTPELQQLLDDIDVELDKRLAAVHPDARYMFRECVVDGNTCHVMGVDNDGTLLIQSHRKGTHSGGGFFGEWVGRDDMYWEWGYKVKLVNEDGSLEDVL